MSLEILNFSWNLVIYVVASFAIGMAGVIFYINLKALPKKSTNHNDNSVAGAVVAEYTRRLQDFEKIIGELRVKIDTVELRMLQHPTSQTSDGGSDMTHGFSHDTRTISQSKSQLQEHHHPPTSDVMESTNVTSPSAVTSDNNNYTQHQSTPDYILKLLVEKSRTSREIQKDIGKTREHTSRLMRRLYESNLVSRDSNNKPFKYYITDQGRKELIFHTTSGETKASDVNARSGSEDSQLNVTVH